jgi:methyl-accepting chemotaxis protein
MDRVRGRVEQTNRATREQGKVSSEIAEMVERMRELGQEVNRVMGEQSRQSQIMTGAVADVAAGVEQILQATRAQAGESETIQQTLGVFRDVAAESSRRAHALHRMIAKLGERSRALQETSDHFET